MNYFVPLPCKISNFMEYDYSLLQLINFDGSPAYDAFWALYTDKFTWIPLALVAVYCLLHKGGWRHALLMVLMLALLFALSDFTVSSLLKNIVARPRPSHDPAIMDALSYIDNYRGGPYGFPSNHASNGFAVAMFLTLLYRSRIVALSTFLWACGSCYSRMYMGVHFPSDILVGAILGTLFALAVYCTYKECYNYLYKTTPLPPFGELYENTIPWAIPAAFILTIIGLLILALTF